MDVHVELKGDNIFQQGQAAEDLIAYINNSLGGEG